VASIIDFTDHASQNTTIITTRARRSVQPNETKEPAQEQVPSASCITVCRDPRFQTTLFVTLRCHRTKESPSTKPGVPPTTGYFSGTYPALMCDSVGQGCGRNSFEALPSDRGGTCNPYIGDTHHTSYVHATSLGLKCRKVGVCQWTRRARTNIGRHLALRMLTGIFNQVDFASVR
jgi:hypothetical protein